MDKLHLEMLLKQKHSTIGNYVIPGLESALLGAADKDYGSVRLFTATRHQWGDITPHSHRFDFVCMVLEGQVINTIWEEEFSGNAEADLFMKVHQEYCGKIGKYKTENVGVMAYRPVHHYHNAGDTYSMTSEQIHTIHFMKGTRVLFFEGAPEGNDSFALEPYVDGDVLSTLETKHWMFRKNLGD